MVPIHSRNEDAAKTPRIHWLSLFFVILLLSSCAPVTATPDSVPITIPSASGPPEGLGETKISAKDNVTMNYVPAGPFVMGTDNGLVDEQPAHVVMLDTF